MTRCIIASLTLAAALTVGCDRRKVDTTRYEPLPIEVWHVQAGAHEAAFETEATVQPLHDAEIRAPLRGVLRWQGAASPGSRCSKGQPIAAIHSEVLAAKLDAARQQLALAQRSLEMQKQAFSMGLISAEKLASYEVAAVQLSSDVRVFESQAADAVVRVPFDGTVTWRADLPDGQEVQENTPLLRVAATGHWKAMAYCSESDIERIESVERWEVIPAGATAPIAGELAESSPDSSVPGRRRVVVSFEPVATLAPGSQATVLASRSTSMAAVTVPTDCVVHVNRQPHVYVVQARSRLSKTGSLRLQPISIGRRLGGEYVVLSGLAAGDIVARSSLDSLAPDMQVAFTAAGQQ